MFPPLIRGDSGVFFENAYEVAVGGEAEIGGDCGGGSVGPTQEAFCLLRFFAEYEVGQRFTGLLFEPCGKIGPAHIELLGHAFRADRLGQVAADIACDVRGELR